MSYGPGNTVPIQFVQKHNKDQCMYFKRNINQYTIADFLLTLSYEAWDSAFEGYDVNVICNSFLNIFLQHYYSSFPVTTHGLHLVYKLHANIKRTLY